MLKSIIFSDEITIWWTKDEFLKKADEYKVYLNGEYCGNTQKTHYTFLNLKVKQAYQVCVEAYLSGELKTIKNYEFETKQAKKRLDVTKPPYNAVGDGKTLNTKALQKALKDCQANEYIYFPAGKFLSGALTVYSDTEIYLEEGAVLQGTDNYEDYLPKIKSRFEGTEMMCYQSLLNIGELDCNDYTRPCKNIAIRGKGEIYGGGRPLAIAMLNREKELLKDFLANNAEYVKTCENEDSIPGRARGRLIQMCNCENVVLSGATMGYGPSWNIQFIYCKDVVTYGCKVCSNTVLNEKGELIRESVWNGDGWAPDSSENCVIFNTTFRTGDDCIAIKSGKNPEGNIVNRPTKNVYIFDCFVEDGHSISIGSEMSGGVENVYIWDCDLSNAYYGVQVKTTKKRGGYVKNLFVFDSLVRVIYARCAAYNDDGEGAETPPRLTNFFYENVKILGLKRVTGEMIYVWLEGFEEPEYHINNISIKDSYVVAKENGNVLYTNNVDNLEWINVQYLTQEEVKEMFYY